MTHNLGCQSHQIPLPGASLSHYGGAMPYQQAPMPDTFVPSRTETHSSDWSWENLQSNEGSLQSMVNPENPRSSHYGGAMPYQQAPMLDTFMPSQTETHSSDWSWENLQSNEGSLQSMVNPENPRSSHYGGAMPYQQAPMPDTFVPSRTETHSSDWSWENLQSNEGSLQSMVNPENPRSSHYGGAIPYQQAPMLDTFVPSRTETHSSDWSWENLQSNEGSLQSMVNPENPRSSHYGGAIPYQQAPMLDTFMPSQTETHSSDWFGENLLSIEGSLQSMVNPENPRSSHYGGAMPYQQAPMPDTFVPSQAETHSLDWSWENLQSNEGSLQSMVNPENPRSSHYGGAIPYQQAPMLDTFMPSQTETHSSDWFGENLLSIEGSLQSMVNPENPRSSHYGGAMPYQQAPMPDTFVPSQAETHSLDWSWENLQSNEGSLQSMVNPENPRSSHYGGAMPYQQAPMPDTFMPSQTETHSLDWSWENLQSNEGSLQSMVEAKKPSSSKSTSKKGKKSRK
ncbi:hypothetical protein GPALN_005877 [Globodera pallida]|nr:hypothetical protein GPALN_005877 [Globodera pallida]